MKTSSLLLLRVLLIHTTILHASKKAFALLFCMLATSLSFCFAQSGTLDSSFGNNGIVKLQHGDSLHVSAVAVQPDNKILTGSSYKVYDALTIPRYHAIPVIQRYKSNGVIDQSFGKNGETFLPYVPSDFAKDPDISIIHDIQVLPNKKIVVTEESSYYVAGASDDEFERSVYHLYRLNSNGSFDSSFGKNGFLYDAFGAGNVLYINSAMQPDGKIIVGGVARFYFQPDTSFVLKRYKGNGVTDSSFGVNGISYYVRNNNDEFQLNQVVVLPTGKILAVGNNSFFSNYYHPTLIDTVTDYHFAMVRFLKNGKIDSSFGVNGTVRTSFPDLTFTDDRYQKEGPTGVLPFPSVKAAVDAKGNIFLSGTAIYNNHYSYTTVAYHPNGTINKIFGSHGKKYKQFPSSNIYTYVAADDTTGNNIVVGGTSGTAVSKLVTVKYLPDGTIDNSFGDNGTATTIIEQDTTEMRDMKTGANGKIVAAALVDGHIYDDTYIGTSYLVRYNNSNTPVTATVNSNAAIATASTTNLLLSPNPAKDVITIQGLLPSSKTIVLVDISGKMVQQVITTNTNYSFNVKSLPAGAYFIKVDGNGESTTLRFVKE